MGRSESPGCDSPNLFAGTPQQMFGVYPCCNLAIFTATRGSNPTTVSAWDHLIAHDKLAPRCRDRWTKVSEVRRSPLESVIALIGVNVSLGFKGEIAGRTSVVLMSLHILEREGRA
jgi:hypothetical protein